MGTTPGLVTSHRPTGGQGQLHCWINTDQWEVQDPKSEALYYTRLYFMGIFPDIGQKHMLGTSNKNRFLFCVHVPGCSPEGFLSGKMLNRFWCVWNGGVQSPKLRHLKWWETELLNQWNEGLDFQTNFNKVCTGMKGGNFHPGEKSIPQKGPNFVGKSSSHTIGIFTKHSFNLDNYR
jgi:hypothetical protein